jgi:hypothetical protein
MSYIGTEPKDIRSFGRTKFDYTATQGQTAFTGADDDGKVLAFTVGQIEVYVNGILMDDSDFTTTGTGTVTLATAANLNDVVNVVSFETNIPDSNYVPASGGTFTGNITASGTLGVTGAVTASNGLTVDDDSATPLTVDRATSFGNVVDIQKDGSTVGGISTFYGNPMFGRNSGARLAFDTNVIYSSNDAGSTADNAYALGSASSRFTDLYLSGGAYLGGTGAANKLDDYETGTWTPTIHGGYSVSAYGVQYGTYTKIGNTVRAYFRLSLSTASTTGQAIIIEGLPFTVVNQGHQYTTGTSYINTASANGDSVKILVFPNESRVYLYYQSTTGVTQLVGTNLGSSLDILGQVVYQV